MVETTATAALAPRAPEELRTSPAALLADRFAAAEVTGPRGVSVREIPFRTMIGIRVLPSSPGAARLRSRLDVTLPAACGEVEQRDGLAVLWLSPDEFLVVGEEDPSTLTAGLVDALAGAAGSVTDLSANRTCFELSGPSARPVLEKGCPLDLHPRAFAVGTAFLTTIGPVPVIVWKTGELTYQIFPRSSFADFLGRWLLDAMAEFAAPELP
ncbi:MAG TPA: sarcosine oxidase subunit gamma family protein [Microlunatus sp.]|nr:sarcosine oxidase subunit gamma family protein [Microlunatus sp.]